MKRILTGLQPSGELTLGSLIGSISQMVKYQDEYESFMFRIIFGLDRENTAGGIP